MAGPARLSYAGPVPSPASALVSPMHLRMQGPPRCAGGRYTPTGGRTMPDGSDSPDQAEQPEQPEQTYDRQRMRQLEAMLLALSERIRELQAQGTLLGHAGELTRLIGDVRSELFHYEVRATYDSPEVAESRRIVAEAQQQRDQTQWQKTEWTPEDGEA